ncbi:MAG: hypothetical protein ACTSXZ_10435 [Alphaproteobacteria bacterium]
MTNETSKTEPLRALAVKIAQYATEADEKTIEAAKLVGEARRRVEAGESGEVKWYTWARDNIKLSTSRLRELQRIAAAEDPQKELKRGRKKTPERVGRYREKKRPPPLRNGGTTVEVTAEMEDDRKSLIEWVRSAPLDHVERVPSYVQELDSTAASPESGDSAAQLGG